MGSHGGRLLLMGRWLGYVLKTTKETVVGADAELFKPTECTLHADMLRLIVL